MSERKSNDGVTERALEVFVALENAVESMELETASDVERCLTTTSAFIQELNESRAPQRVKDAAYSLYEKIAKKHCAIVQPFCSGTIERKEKQRDRSAFYVLETLALIATTATTITCVIMKVHLGVTIACVLGNLFFACALLFFHVGELGRVEKVVDRTVDVILGLFGRETKVDKTTENDNSTSCD